MQPVQRFSRNADLPDGTQGEARFNVIRLVPRSVFDGRVYFCEHVTPDMIWRPEWQDHPNGALGFARVAIAARDPDRIAQMFDRMFDAGTVARAAKQDTPHVLRAGSVAVEIWPHDALAATLGAAMPDPAGRGDTWRWSASVCARWMRRQETLRANGIRNVQVEPGRILVPAAEAMNTALEFVAQGG